MNKIQPYKPDEMYSFLVLVGHRHLIQVFSFQMVTSEGHEIEGHLRISHINSPFL